MVSRSEVDLKRIKEEYKKKYGKTLYQEILVSKYVTISNYDKGLRVTLEVRIVSLGPHRDEYKALFSSLRQRQEE